MGENIIGEFESQDVFNNAYKLTISGSGAMYDSMYDFVSLGTGSWGSCWNKCINDTVIIPDGITTIADRCFQLSIDITTYNKVNSIIIGSSVRKIGAHAFEQYGLEGYIDSIEFSKVIIKNPSILEEIESYAFRGCRKLKYIDFGGYTPRILGSNIFEDCYSLISTNFGKEISVGIGMFTNCYSLKSFNEDNSVSNFNSNTTLGIQHPCFHECRSIEHFRFTEDCQFETDSTGAIVNANDFFYVTPYTGSNQDENGLQITLIDGDSTWAICHAWKLLENRKVIMDSGRPYLILKHLGKDVIIPCHPKPYNEDLSHFYPIKHKDRIWYLRNNQNIAYNASPLLLKDRGEYVFICY